MTRLRSPRQMFAHLFRPERAVPPRSVRIQVRVNGEPAVDIDSKLALYQLDCNYGQPVTLTADLPGALHVEVIMTEGDS